MSYHELAAKGLPRGARRGWHQMKGPGRVLTEMTAGYPGRLDGKRYSANWMDHVYRYPLGGGQWAYVAEPYGVTDRALDDLAHLRQCGYRVTIDARDARWFPGRTVAITIVRGEVA